MFDQLLLYLNSSSSRITLERLSTVAQDNFISTDDVFQHLLFLQACGVEFSTLDEQSCQLASPLDILSVNEIKKQISSHISIEQLSIERHLLLDSTNSEIAKLSPEEIHLTACLAEYQTAGRGRHGRQWLAPLASGLCISLGWCFTQTPKDIQLISLLPAVALVRALRRIGLNTVGVKWPNDIVCQGEKLAGILIEMPAKQSANQAVIIGVGLNVYERSVLKDLVPQPLTSIEQQIKNIPTRNEICANLLSELIILLRKAEQEGFAAIRDEWREYDVYLDQPVCLENGTLIERGIGRGINEQGALLVEIQEQIKQYVSGEIRLRPDIA